MASGGAECGFCLTQISDVGELKTLPCGHSHCKSCLVNLLEVGEVLSCPDCDRSPPNKVNQSSKPAPARRYVHFELGDLCDICMEKGRENVVAVSYCTNEKCSKQYCSQHKKLHDELMEGHHMFSLNERSRETVECAKGFCPKHPDKPLTMGCKRCMHPLCMDCLEDTKGCKGGHHQAVSLSTLFKDVQQLVKSLETKVGTRKGKLSALSKECTQLLARYDKDTETITAQIHKTRDEQIKAIQEGYAQLEANMARARLGPREEISQFQEKTIEKSLKKLNSGIEALVSGLSAGHESDGVNCFNKMNGQLAAILGQALPSLTVRKPVTKLKDMGKNRSLELSAVKLQEPVAVGTGDLDRSQLSLDSEPSRRKNCYARPERRQPHPGVMSHMGYQSFPQTYQHPSAWHSVRNQAGFSAGVTSTTSPGFWESKDINYTQRPHVAEGDF